MCCRVFEDNSSVSFITLVVWIAQSYVNIHVLVTLLTVRR